jgi:hypothetical protein
MREVPIWRGFLTLQVETGVDFSSYPFAAMTLASPLPARRFWSAPRV